MYLIGPNSFQNDLVMCIYDETNLFPQLLLINKDLHLYVLFDILYF
jgi:hypothetical protein